MSPVEKPTAPAAIPSAIFDCISSISASDGARETIPIVAIRDAALIDPQILDPSTEQDLHAVLKRYFGYDIANYDASWAEWGNDDETPIVAGD